MFVDKDMAIMEEDLLESIELTLLIETLRDKMIEAHGNKMIDALGDKMIDALGDKIIGALGDKIMIIESKDKNIVEIESFKRTRKRRKSKRRN